MRALGTLQSSSILSWCLSFRLFLRQPTLSSLWPLLRQLLCLLLTFLPMTSQSRCLKWLLSVIGTFSSRLERLRSHLPQLVLWMNYITTLLLADSVLTSLGILTTLAIQLATGGFLNYVLRLSRRI